MDLHKFFYITLTKLFTYLTISLQELTTTKRLIIKEFTTLKTSDNINQLSRIKNLKGLIINIFLKIWFFELKNMMKVKMKISGCFRHFSYTKIFCRIRSYISTIKKNGMAVFQSLVDAFSQLSPSFLNSLQFS